MLFDTLKANLTNILEGWDAVTTDARAIAQGLFNDTDVAEIAVAFKDRWKPASGAQANEGSSAQAGEDSPSEEQRNSSAFYLPQEESGTKAPAGKKGKKGGSAQSSPFKGILDDFIKTPIETGCLQDVLYRTINGQMSPQVLLSILTQPQLNTTALHILAKHDPKILNFYIRAVFFAILADAKEKQLSMADAQARCQEVLRNLLKHCNPSGRNAFMIAAGFSAIRPADSEHGSSVENLMYFISLSALFEPESIFTEEALALELGLAIHHESSGRDSMPVPPRQIGKVQRDALPRCEAKQTLLGFLTHSFYTRENKQGLLDQFINLLNSLPQDIKQAWLFTPHTFILNKSAKMVLPLEHMIFSSCFAEEPHAVLERIFPEVQLTTIDGLKELYANYPSKSLILLIAAKQPAINFIELINELNALCSNEPVSVDDLLPPIGTLGVFGELQATRSSEEVRHLFTEIFTLIGLKSGEEINYAALAMLTEYVEQQPDNGAENAFISLLADYLNLSIDELKDALKYPPTMLSDHLPCVSTLSHAGQDVAVAYWNVLARQYGGNNSPLLRDEVIEKPLMEAVRRTQQVAFIQAMLEQDPSIEVVALQEASQELANLLLAQMGADEYVIVREAREQNFSEVRLNVSSDLVMLVKKGDEHDLLHDEKTGIEALMRHLFSKVQEAYELSANEMKSMFYQLDARRIHLSARLSENNLRIFANGHLRGREVSLEDTDPTGRCEYDILFLSIFIKFLQNTLSGKSTNEALAEFYTDFANVISRKPISPAEQSVDASLDVMTTGIRELGAQAAGLILVGDFNRTIPSEYLAADDYMTPLNTGFLEATQAELNKTSSITITAATPGLTTVPSQKKNKDDDALRSRDAAIAISASAEHPLEFARSAPVSALGLEQAAIDERVHVDLGRLEGIAEHVVQEYYTQITASESAQQAAGKPQGGKKGKAKAASGSAMPVEKDAEVVAQLVISVTAKAVKGLSQLQRRPTVSAETTVNEAQMSQASCVLFPPHNACAEKFGWRKFQY